MGFNELFAKNHTILLDGGMGTTLEHVFHKDITHPLWSTRPVEENEETIIAAHLAFLRAGSQVVLTSTYQAAYETFRRANYVDSDAERLMCKSVKLAVEACKRFETEATPVTDSKLSGLRRRPYVGLSLGPFGATLENLAEFSGKYPPPYGPAPVLSAVGESTTIIEEQSNEDALAAFHFSRLLVYASEASTWDTIDIVVFETVPLVTEAKAIRRAVARLEDWFRETSRENTGLRAQEMKPWYISFVFPGPKGEFVQYHRWDGSLGSQRYTPSEILKVTLLPQNFGSAKMATPNAIGVNCTKPSEVFPVMDEFIATTKELLRVSPNCFGDQLPWLALSPGGVSNWAELVRWKLDQNPQWASVFGGLLLGGCCNVVPHDIEDLKGLLCKHANVTT